MKKFILISSIALFLFLTACAEVEPKPFVPSSGHISEETQAASDIPELATQTPVLPAPAPAAELEKYTVVVNEVPVKELLFALARDAQVNVDIDPVIEGVVTINAIDQTLPQILDRIARQVDLRYVYNGDNLQIMPDLPYLRTYTIDYVNMSRDTSSSNTVATQISSASGGGESSGGGGNNSTTDVTSISNHHFWETLVLNVSAILGDAAGGGGGSGALPITDTVIPNPEAGLLAVRATDAQHKQIQEFIDQAQERAQRQVLIQVTIAEVQLSEDYQAGIDWSFLQSATKAGVQIISGIVGGPPAALALAAARPLILEYQDPNQDRDNKIQASVKLLDQFGNVRIMSSPQLMVLNNQTATLKVVENIVYFEIESEVAAGQGLSQAVTSVDTTAVTVPVGIVMAVTPQISSTSTVSLNVRPTISRISEFVPDPNPEQLVDGDGIPLNQVPQIVIREMESMLRLNDGQIAVLGGLMQDTSADSVDGYPVISDVPGVGAAFKTTTKAYEKTELVIFIQPTIIQTASLDADLNNYRQYLNPSRESLLPPPRSLLPLAEGSEAQ
jgi:MSHA biogenesis protein MshL